MSLESPHTTKELPKQMTEQELTQSGVDSMLASEPEPRDDFDDEAKADFNKSLQNWRKLKLTRTMYEEFYARVTPEQPTIDYAGTKLKRWTDSDGDNCHGMVSKSNEKEHGIVRQIGAGRYDGTIFTLTRKNGKA